MASAANLSTRNSEGSTAELRMEGGGRKNKSDDGESRAESFLHDDSTLWVGFPSMSEAS